MQIIVNRKTEEIGLNLHSYRMLQRELDIISKISTLATRIEQGS